MSARRPPLPRAATRPAALRRADWRPAELRRAASRGAALAARAALAGLAVLAGCAQRGPAVVLLPSLDGRPSAVTVSAGGRELVLDRPWAAAGLADGVPVAMVLDGDGAAVRERYGALLSAQPERPRRFTLPFDANASRLAAGAEAVLGEVRAALARLPAAELIVTGHTDRVGSEAANDRLSLARAEAVREWLVAAGIARASITVVGRGEREPLVPTADEVAEPRNRRVEIKLR